MDYMGNKEYWDDKFAKRSNNPLSPEKSLVENIALFKQGSVLDLACGDGRNTLFLLEKGFRVTGVDFSAIALERLKMFAQANNYLADTKQIDLSIPGSLKAVGVYDNILVNHYRLNKEQLEDIENHIAYNGILFICGFGHKHKADLNIRCEDLIRTEDFEDIKKAFRQIKYIEIQEERGFFVTYIYQKI